MAKSPQIVSSHWVTKNRERGILAHWAILFGFVCLQDFFTSKVKTQVPEILMLMSNKTRWVGPLINGSVLLFLINKKRSTEKNPGKIIMHVSTMLRSDIFQKNHICKKNVPLSYLNYIKYKRFPDWTKYVILVQSARQRLPNYR